MKGATRTLHWALVDFKLYVLACSIMACAITLRVLLNPIIGQSEYPFVTLGGAVVFCSWYCGLGPSVVATLGGILYVWREFLPPVDSFALSNIRTEGGGLVLFGVVAGLIIALGEKMRRAQNLAHKKSEQLLLAQHAARAGSFEWDSRTGIVRWSPELETMHGLQQGQFSGTMSAWLELIHPGDKEEANRRFNLALQKGTFEGEWRVVWADRSVRWILGRGLMFREETGTSERVLGVNIDITERKQAESTNNLLAAIVDSSDDAIVSKTLEGIITSWNKSAERLFGYSAAEAVGQPITLIIPPDRIPEESDILSRLSRGERIDHFETVRQRKDRSLIEVSLTISPVKDFQGRITGASKVARDITAQKQAERALRESEQRFRMVTDASPIMVWMSGTDKLCFYFNKGWLDFVGRALEEETGSGWTANIHPDDFDRCVQTYSSSFDARRSFEMEYRLRHHTGEYRWIFDRGVPRYAPDGTFEGYVGGCMDIHDQKEAAERGRVAGETLRLMKTQDEERRRIARELHDSAGQTLTVLGLSLAQLVRKAAVVAPELSRQGNEIEEMVQQLHREIRTTSYLLHPPLLDETGLSSALDWYVQGVAERSGIAIDLDISRDFGRLPGEMELAIFRIVQECLTNIHRHADSETASIRVAREGASICIEVRDKGKGISPERLAEIHSRGSGVGISGIRERLRQFHGAVKIESSGAGTTVLARIPFPAGTAADPKQVRAAV
jgi:PAS domain S-box-containing protein